LADYNAGRLHGVWIDANQDPKDIRAAVDAMLAESMEPVAEEWAIHDYEGFEGIRLGEWESFENVSAIARGIENHGEAFAAFVRAFGLNNFLGQAVDENRFLDAYRGVYNTFTDFAHQYINDAGLLADVPEQVAAYF